MPDCLRLGAWPGRFLGSSRSSRATPTGVRSQAARQVRRGFAALRGKREAGPPTQSPHEFGRLRGKTGEARGRADALRRGAGLGARARLGSTQELRGPAPSSAREEDAEIAGEARQGCSRRHHRIARWRRTRTGIAECIAARGPRSTPRHRAWEKPRAPLRRHACRSGNKGNRGHAHRRYADDDGGDAGDEWANVVSSGTESQAKRSGTVDDGQRRSNQRCAWSGQPCTAPSWVTPRSVLGRLDSQ